MFFNGCNQFAEFFVRDFCIVDVVLEKIYFIIINSIDESFYVASPTQLPKTKSVRRESDCKYKHYILQNFYVCNIKYKSKD